MFQWLFLLSEYVEKLKRNANQIVPLNAHNPCVGELAHLQSFADFFWRQQLHHTINLGRISIGAAQTALATQRWR